MADYLSLTDAEKRAMLDTIGVEKVDDLFEDIPNTLRCKKLNLPDGKSQQETYAFMRALSKRNRIYDSIFMGAEKCDYLTAFTIPNNVRSIEKRAFANVGKTYDTKFHIYLFSFKSLYFSRVFEVTE